MWSERAPQNLVESKVFPRAIGLAEVLWSGASITQAEGSYDRFLKRLDVHFNRLAILGVDYGLEAVPVSMSLSLEEGDERKLFAQITPSDSYIKGQAIFNGVDGESNPVYFGTPLEIDGPGEIVATINYRGRVLEKTENFPVDFHAATFKELELGYEPSPYYDGGGDYALVDGRIGTSDFRDGVWQAKQGENLSFSVNLGETTDIDSISLNFFLYQDAWIFHPSNLKFFVDDILVHELTNSDVFDKDDRQISTNFSTGKLEGVAGNIVRVEVINPGPCPDWHAAATELTWLFVDELIVRKAK